MDVAGKTSTRDVNPHGLLVQVPLWYLIAYDLDKDAPRTFRLDRISGAVAYETLRFEPLDPRELIKDIVEYA